MVFRTEQEDQFRNDTIYSALADRREELKQSIALAFDRAFTEKRFDVLFGISVFLKDFGMDQGIVLEHDRATKRLDAEIIPLFPEKQDRRGGVHHDRQRP